MVKLRRGKHNLGKSSHSKGRSSVAPICIGRDTFSQESRAARGHLHSVLVLQFSYVQTETALATFYRIVTTAQPAPADFLSQSALRNPPRQASGDTTRLWESISVYENEGQASATANRYPKLGAFIAELEIDESSHIHFERTTLSLGHHTLWGEAIAICACVRRVMPV